MPSHLTLPALAAVAVVVDLMRAVRQSLNPPTDPNDINTVLAWLVPILFGAIAWQQFRNERDNKERHAEKDRQHERELADRDRAHERELARAIKTNDDLLLANREHAETNRALVAAVQAQTAEIGRLHDLLVPTDPPARRTRT